MQTIPIGIFSRTYSGPIKDVMQQISAAGYTCLQFNMSSAGLDSMPKQYPDHILHDINHLQEEFNLSISGISGTYNLIHPDKKYRRDYLVRLEIMMQQMETLKIPMVSLCSGTRNIDNMWQGHQENNSNEVWNELCHELEKVVLLAEKYAVLIGIEPEKNNVINSVEKAQRLLDQMQSPAVKIIYDPANLFDTGSVSEIESMVMYGLDKLYPHLVMVHAKDIEQNGNYVPAGKGVMPFAKMIDALRNNKFEGSIIAHELKANEAVQVCNYLKSI